MKKLQERKISMFIVVEEGLSKTDTQIIEIIPRYKFYHDSLISFIESIRTVSEKQEINISGTAILKASHRAKLVKTSLDISRKVNAYAINVENDELQKEINYSKSRLEDSPDTGLRDKCQIIHDKAKFHITSLADYGITAQVLSNLQKEIDFFAQLIPAPRLKIAKKKDATNELGVLIKNTDTLLKKMDKVFEMVRDSHYDFYRNYKNNRIIINPSTHPSSLLGSVKDEKNIPVPNVIITEPKTGLLVKTGPKGTFRVKKMQPGNYEFHFAKNGFEEQKVKAAINEKETTKIHLIFQEV